MLSKFDRWIYQDDQNCWDYVREWLIEKAGIPADDVPKFGIPPDDKRAMTRAADGVVKTFEECKARQHAVACEYRGKLLWHVGIVDRGIIRHVGRKTGLRKEKIADFERARKHVEYRIHKCLL